MAITFEGIDYSAIDQSVYEACLIRSMDAIQADPPTWKWEEFGLTNESSVAEKKAKLLEKCSTGVNFVCKVDGYIVEFNEGRMEKNGEIFQMGVSVCRADQNGSLSWNYHAEYVPALLGFLKTQANKTSCWCPVNCSMWNWFKTHHDAGNFTYTIDSETPTIQGVVYNKFVIDLT